MFDDVLPEANQAEECADLPESSPGDRSEMLPPVDRERLAQNLPDYREDLVQFQRAYEQLQENYPDFFQRMRDSNPRFERSLERLDKVNDFLSRAQELTDTELLDYVDEYNRLAGGFNTLFSRMEREQQEQTEDSMVSMLEGENLNPEFFENLSEAEKAELAAFGRELYKEIFPDSYTDVAVKFYTGRDELSPFQRYALMPANAIESVGHGVVNLLNPKTWGELKASVDTLRDMEYEDYVTAWEFLKFQYDQLSTTDKVVPAVTFILSAAFLIGGIAQVSQSAKAAGHGREFVVLLESLALAKAATHTMAPLVNTVPAQVLGGLHLRYMEV